MYKAEERNGRYKWGTFNKEEYLKEVNKAIEADIKERSYECAVDECKLIIEVLADWIERLEEENGEYYKKLIDAGVIG